jgi:hypothetical protein
MRFINICGGGAGIITDNLGWLRDSIEIDSESSE